MFATLSWRDSVYLDKLNTIMELLKSRYKINEKGSDVILHRMLDDAPFGVLYFSPAYDNTGKVKDFKLEMHNKKINELIGCYLQDKRHIFVEDVLNACGETRWLEMCKKVFETGESLSEHVTFDNTGTERTNRLQIEKSGDGLAVYFADIHELHQTIQELGEDEKKYRLLFETSLDGIFLTDVDFNIISFNPKFGSKFLYDVEQPETQLRALFQREEAYELFTRRLREKQFVEEFETNLYNSKGVLLPCVINCIPVVDDQGKVIFYQGVVRDISMKKQAERELVLAGKLSLTGKLARNIAHEVRNPLTNLRLALDQLKDELPEGFDDGNFFIDTILRNADRIQLLINDLLQSSRPKELKVSSENIHNVIDETLTLIRDRLNLKNMQLRVKYDKNVPEVMCDKDQLKIALLNLLLNALEAMESGKGVLSVETRYTGGQLEIVIGDNGCGMTEEELEHLFEPFFTSKQQGTGLGLTNTQNIVRSHHGTLDVLSQEGIGSEFTVRLNLGTL
jgi:two-component system, sporulation sensor kinase E